MLGLWLGAGTALAAPGGEVPEGRIKHAVSALGRLKAGKELLEKARRHWLAERDVEGEALLKYFRPGAESRTDAVITRYFNPRTGVEHREREVVIYLRVEQPLEDIVLDLAHELVHAVSRPSWDPYDPKLTPADYIRTAIEGEGGEVAAVATECRVGLELAALSGASVERCRAYVPPGSVQVSLDKIRRDFYRVGKWGGELGRLLGNAAAELPLLSSDAPVLFSSTGHTPYPMALYREFEQITEIACENSRKRLRAGTANRGLASSSAARTQVTRFLAQRCEEAREPKRAAR